MPLVTEVKRRSALAEAAVDVDKSPFHRVVKLSGPSLNLTFDGIPARPLVASSEGRAYACASTPMRESTSAPTACPKAPPTRCNMSKNMSLPE